MVCPMIKSPTIRHRQLAPVAGLPRGEAELAAFVHCGIPKLPPHGRIPHGYDLFALWDVVERIPFGQSKELAGQLEKAVDEDSIDVATRLFWHGEDDSPELAALIRRDTLEAFGIQHSLGSVYRDRTVKLAGHSYPMKFIR